MSNTNRLSLRNSRSRSTSSFQQIPEDQQIQDNQRIQELKNDTVLNNNDNNDSNIRSDQNDGWNSFLNFGSEFLENKGSVARDHVCITTHPHGIIKY
ncbi:hypothetical protein BN7_1309 [Wickerhamomyces ciferrii]|uniref:Uncharacterized protein n=1 Tax=Wickerhamomyces ciferrii (strain ATCC 14091 / BCRC 22168 / CBS 111 / JCM 3599 / NBRC 0793 / NRRL Y-1031 F-60-10) TaxID=1206466 RepID=K0KA32_WICCF|nr:uncharacterized protein BN7_1309 [Wickerhamomyces ciferrii]CCH41770.1 hypothetical protein BN7_1309 [Wickerhamomyces ciferrii]